MQTMILCMFLEHTWFCFPVCGAELSRIKATLPFEKGYGVLYHRVTIYTCSYYVAQNNSNRLNRNQSNQTRHELQKRDM